MRSRLLQSQSVTIREERRERHTYTDRQIDRRRVRQIDRQRDRPIDTERDRLKEIQAETDTNGDMGIYT